MMESPVSIDFKRILERGKEGYELGASEGKKLLESSGSELDELLEAADFVREEEVGDIVTYVVNRNLNFTNVCRNRCKFCAFRRAENSSDAYTLTSEEVKEKVREGLEKGATEICFQGGINPNLEFHDYLEYLKSMRSVSSEVHIHAFSPEEINHISSKSGMGLEETLLELRNAGLDSVVGTAAEILVDRVRNKICPEKISASRWEEIIRTCHRLGIPTTSTMLYGHLETSEDIIEHLMRIRDIQVDTGGFTELVPLAFSSKNTELGKIGLVNNMKPEEHLRIYAVARLMLTGKIPNIQASWVKLGPTLAQMTLSAGANDFSGTLMEENITSSAGGEREEIEPWEIRNLIREAGKVPRERTTTYKMVV